MIFTEEEYNQALVVLKEMWDTCESSVELDALLNDIICWEQENLSEL